MRKRISHAYFALKMMPCLKATTHTIAVGLMTVFERVTTSRYPGKATIAFAFFVTMSLIGLPAAAQTSDTERDGVERVRLQDQDFGYFFGNSKWPAEANGKTLIPVCWEKDALTKFPNETDWVKSAVSDSWQAHSRIDFVGWKPCATFHDGIRIVVLDGGPRVNAFGKELNGLKEGMELNFTFQNWSPSCKNSESSRQLCIRSIAVHEFGHAIGFAHEQDRADTPGECTRRTGTTGIDLQMLTPYDPKSVMNYCNSTYNNDGKLSPGDIASVQQKYGAR